jgi:hypothetical protein
MKAEASRVSGGCRIRADDRLGKKAWCLGRTPSHIWLVLCILWYLAACQFLKIMLGTNNRLSGVLGWEGGISVGSRTNTG